MTETIVLGGGCFWCLDAVFRHVRGVSSVVCGYAGGEDPHPTYEAVCTGTTGHAEVVSVCFDPSVLSYTALLEIFFAMHDPTTLNRQGYDVGTQYRSVIFTHNDAQQTSAEDLVKKIAPAFNNPIVTEIRPCPVFYPAEAYHQNYHAQHPENAYCQAVISPKLYKLAKLSIS